MTEIEIDQSHLPRVFGVCQCFSLLEDGALAHSLQEQEIERFYSGSMQKRRELRDDGRLARRMQDEEEEQGAHLIHCLRQLEKRDCEYAKTIQEDLRRREEEEQRREEEDEELARRLQQEEEQQIRRRRVEAGCHDDSGASPLSEGLEVWSQVMRDAELARRLQEEEDRQCHRERRGPNTDFHAAQVAQDEEIARFIQRQDRKIHSRSHDLGPPGRSHDPTATVDAPLRKMETLLLPRERLNSQGLSSPVEEPVLEQHPLSPEHTTLGVQPVRNIAEELDPTFTSRKRESQVCSSSSGVHLAPRTPHSIFYDYLPEPAFVPPTRRHGNQPGRDRAKEKRQNCKQQ